MWVVVMLAMLVGCTHRTSVRHAGEAIGEPGVVKLRTGEQRNVTLVGYVPTGIVVNDGYQVWQVPYENLESLEYESHAGGAWQGVKYGALVGALIGVAWGVAISSADADDSGFLDEPGEAIAFGTIMFGLTGVLFGAPIGAIKGKTTVYSMDAR